MPQNRVLDSLFCIQDYSTYYNYSNRNYSVSDSLPWCYIFSIPSSIFDDEVLIVMATQDSLLGIYTLYFALNGNNFQWYYDNNIQIPTTLYSVEGTEIAAFDWLPRSNEIYFTYVNQNIFNGNSKSMSVGGVLCNLAGAYAGHIWIQSLVNFAGPIGGWGLLALHIGVTLVNYYACSDL